MTNYQHYNKEEFIKRFSQTEIFNKLINDYQYLYSDLIDMPPLSPEDPPHRSDLEAASVFLYSMFYYIEFLTEINPNIIADIGCGKNFLKKYIDNIIGFDKTTEADVHCYFDDKFINDNLKKFDAAISINSLHFIKLNKFADRINDFGKIIRSGGRGFVTFNIKRMMERTEPHEYAKLFDLSDRLTADDYINYIKEEIKKINYKIIVDDILFLSDHIDKQRKHYEFCRGADWPTFESMMNGNYDNVPENIIKEIESFSIFNTEVNYEDAFNGNIRIVFEV